MVKERTSVKGEYKELELLSTNNLKILIIKNQKKERLPLNEKDSLLVVTIMQNYDKKLEKEFISLGEKTLAFEVDTVHLKKEHLLYNTTDNFFKNRKKIKKQLTEKENNRIILDGTTYQIIITDSMGETDVFYVHSPTEDSHPNIFELLSAFRSTYKTPQP
ncbi:hypothetical protein GCM10007103_29430 [Salinimicrobium marinum]|uniref:Uncharacterized protein n=2 Tax=Salinimicrobium marinum TaxID=680283 RepID=A0A918SKK7_9FLAO|nr:hypothetical protein GCM10007103_29430 [Salinimicrobium marinum]